MVRSNIYSPFPQHVFMRGPNLVQHQLDRIGNRESPFEATMVHLTEPFTGREVFLIGTVNVSNMLATRTQELIHSVKPDTVIVQSSEEWWKFASKLRHVESQEELNSYAKYFSKLNSFSEDGLSFFRRLVFYPRMWITNKLMRLHFHFGFEYNPLIEGIEVKYACEAAEDTGAKIEFIGNELNKTARAALFHET
jgi:hypothetical protein